MVCGCTPKLKHVYFSEYSVGLAGATCSVWQWNWRSGGPKAKIGSLLALANSALSFFSPCRHGALTPALRSHRMMGLGHSIRLARSDVPMQWHQSSDRRSQGQGLCRAQGTPEASPSAAP